MRAIISVSDKTGLDLLGRGLAKLNAEIYATGGTQRALETAGVPVRPVSDLTGFPEILGGRVKTLHPAVHGGILARRDRPADREDLVHHGLSPIDLVAVNLYPFEAMVTRPDVTLVAALEQIDIGGPALLRAAAKNFPAVVPLCDPSDYATVLAALRQPGGPAEALRRRLAAKAFRHTSVYDALVAAYLGGQETDWPVETALGLRLVRELRYGENAHQRAAFYALARPGQAPAGLTGAQQLQGKALSYTNILDMDAAWTVVSDFEPATVAIVKHTNPCGLACARDVVAAYELALSGDPLAAFGGIVAANAPVDEAFARRLVERFYEAILAPTFTDGALEILSARPNLRVLGLPLAAAPDVAWQGVTGGLLVQETDRLDASEVRQGCVVTGRAVTDEEWAALEFAWRAVRHVKSNAIVLARGSSDGERHALGLVGMGAGQPSRVAAVALAVQQAGPRAAQAVLASDAFFPKPDSIEVAARAGVRAIVQPGGSLGDEAVIAAADAAGMAMVFTGKRHFLH
jgi:phosphoribosylaminoimidazolecarboxamide formyltransferase/IMP cyclohydrolase